MQVWTGLFGFAALFFLLGGNFLIESGNWIGSFFFQLPRMPLPTENFWLSLTTSLMVTLTAICFYIQKDIHTNKKLTIFVLISKLTSTLVFLFAFLGGPHYFNYLLGSLFCDGPIFFTTLYFYQKSLRSDTTPACQQSF